VLKSQVALNELEPNSIDIMCSSIIEKYINRLNQYELLSFVEFSYFYNIKKNSKHCKPKIIRFVNYNKYKYIENCSIIIIIIIFAILKSRKLSIWN
jgi:hypothetical protein